MGDFVSGRGFASQNRSGPSQADIARAEYEASLRRKADDKVQKRRKRVSKRDRGWHEGWHDYDAGQRMNRIHDSIDTIREEIRLIESLPATNRKERRTKQAILRRLHHAIDAMPNR